MPKFLSNRKGIIPLVVIVAAGIISSSGVTIAASQGSVPGDALYPVKKVTENVRVATAFSKQNKAEVHIAIAEEKVKEIEKLEEKGKTDKIAEAAQNLKNSQDQALELTQEINAEGQNVDELVERLEVQTKLQQVVITRISPKISIQIGETLRKSLEQFRKELGVVVESVEEDGPEDSNEKEDSDQQETSQQTPCPSPSSSEEETYDQEDKESTEDEKTDYEEERWEEWDNKYLYNEEENGNEDVQGVRQLQNSRNSSFSSDSRDPCDSTEENSAAGSQTFDGGAENSDGIEGSDDGVSPGGDQGGEAVGAPTSTNPDVEGVSTTGGLLQLLLRALFGPQKQ